MIFSYSRLSYIATSHSMMAVGSRMSQVIVVGAIGTQIFGLISCTCTNKVVCTHSSFACTQANAQRMTKKCMLDQILILCTKSKVYQMCMSVQVLMHTKNKEDTHIGIKKGIIKKSPSNDYCQQHKGTWRRQKMSWRGS
jgi:hypothetical protein